MFSDTIEPVLNCTILISSYIKKLIVICVPTVESVLKFVAKLNPDAGKVR